MAFSKIGTIVRTHGLKGKVVLWHPQIEAADLILLDHLFIELLPGSYIPFFFNSPPGSKGAEYSICYFEEVESIEEAKEILNRDVFIEQSLYERLYPEEATFNFIGFQIEDENSQRQGHILNIQEMGGQLMATIVSEEKEYLIPLNEDFIQHIDKDGQKIYLQLPEGIWDL